MVWPHIPAKNNLFSYSQTVHFERIIITIISSSNSSSQASRPSSGDFPMLHYIIYFWTTELSRDAMTRRAVDRRVSVVKDRPQQLFPLPYSQSICDGDDPRKISIACLQLDP